MVEVLAAPVGSSPVERLRRLHNGDSAALVALCADDPIVNCFPLSRIAGSLAGSSAGSFWGWFDPQGSLQSALYAGANVVPISTDRISRLAFAERLMRLSPRCSALVGPSEEVLDLWALLEPAWGVPREVRATQPLLVCSQVTRGTTRLPLRFAENADLPALLPASVAMFTEELGISPASAGMAVTYESRVRELIANERVLVHVIDGEIVFKAEIGSIANGVCLIQGVWVRPECRGLGVGTAGMAAVVDLALRTVADVVSLYVNIHNVTAINAYRRVGFSEHAEFATILR